MEVGSQPVRQRWRAPAENGRALIVPSREKFGELLAANRTLIASQREREPWPGFAKLQVRVREELIRAARNYTAEYADDLEPAMSGGTAAPIFLSGHQPELFHPGVWFKNFLLSSAAQEHGGIAINLIVDNDTERGGAIAVPTFSGDSAERTLVEYDAVVSERPYEERRFANDEIWASFPQRFAAATQTWKAHADGFDAPLFQRWYAAAQQSRSRNNVVGRVFAEGRHRLEREFGLRTWEVPLSQICQHATFIEFVRQLISDLPRLHEVYNAALGDYRRENRLRSHSHPAPDLERIDDWFEVPLWMWSTENPTRRRVFARRVAADFELSDRDKQSLRLPGAGDCDPLAAWESKGLKLRPRALVTTLFARLLASDVFIHGIGGAKYDEVTERIAAGLWQVDLPRHITATATIRLPFRLHGVDDRAVAELRQRIRNLNWHAEKELPRDEILVVEKERLIANALGDLGPRERAKKLEEVNEQLRAKLPAQVAELLRSLPGWLRLRAADQLLGSREYSFVLHSEKIFSQLLDLCWQKS